MDTVIRELSNWFAALDGWLARIIMLAIVLFVVLLSKLIAQKIVLKTIKRVVGKTSTKWDDVLFERGVFKRLVHYVPVTLIYFFLPLIISHEGLLQFSQRIVLAYMFGFGITVVSKFLDGVNIIYQDYEISKSHPIKGYLQVLQIMAYLAGILLAVTTIIGTSPLAILSGIGAMSAVIILVFKDSILGLVSSIQLSANSQVRIGDWIEVPQFGADGSVTDITLQSVMVQNWDMTIVTLPTYALTTSSFKNWRGMSDSGGRRIKRSLAIDMQSIRFLSDEELEKMEDIPLLRDYIGQKKQELQEYNSKEEMLKRQLTNIGTFRAYVAAYLKYHPQIHNSGNMTFLIRQLPPTAEGLPLEIYVFSRELNWARYEDIQSDMFDHILSVLPQFALAIYQDPSGLDFRKFGFGSSNSTSSNGANGDSLTGDSTSGSNNGGAINNSGGKG